MDKEQFYKIPNKTVLTDAEKQNLHNIRDNIVNYLDYVVKTCDDNYYSDCSFKMNQYLYAIHEIVSTEYKETTNKDLGYFLVDLVEQELNNVKYTIDSDTVFENLDMLIKLKESDNPYCYSFVNDIKDKNPFIRKLLRTVSNNINKDNDIDAYSVYAQICTKLLREKRRRYTLLPFFGYNYTCELDKDKVYTSDKNYIYYRRQNRVKLYIRKPSFPKSKYDQEKKGFNETRHVTLSQKSVSNNCRTSTDLKNAYQNRQKTIDRVLNAVRNKRVIRTRQNLKNKISEKQSVSNQQTNNTEEEIPSVGNTTGNSVANSVDNSVSNSVDNSVINSVGNSVGNTISNSVGNTTGNSVSNSINNTTGNSVSNCIVNTNGNCIVNTNGNCIVNTNGNCIVNTNGNSISNSVGNSVSNSVGNTTSNSVDNTTSNSVDNTTSNSVDNTTSNSINNSISNSVNNSSLESRKVRLSFYKQGDEHIRKSWEVSNKSLSDSSDSLILSNNSTSNNKEAEPT